jgi:hypothetical protein
MWCVCAGGVAQTCNIDLSALYFHSDTRELRLDAPPAFFRMLCMRPQAALLLALHSPAPL